MSGLNEQPMRTRILLAENRHPLGEKHRAAIEVRTPAVSGDEQPVAGMRGDAIQRRRRLEARPLGWIHRTARSIVNFRWPPPDLAGRGRIDCRNAARSP